MKKLLPFLFSILVLIICPIFGYTDIAIKEIFNTDTQANFIFWQLRIPRTLLCWLCGGGLAIGGMAFQALFRNDLASPFTLGISSGAALGVAVLTVFEIQILIESGSVIYAAGAFLGSLLAISFILKCD